jgi:hypothetical protein
MYLRMYVCMYYPKQGTCITHYHTLTPQSRVLNEKVIVALEILRRLWNTEFHYRVHKNPTLGNILRHLNRVFTSDGFFP